MLRVLLAKDLRRALRNPLPWVINLIVPIALTGLIGLAFGGNNSGGALGKIRFAVVDEDHSVLSRFLRGAADNQQGSQVLEPVFMERDEAMREINASHLSAVLIIPTNFMSHYLRASEPVSLELIKNPAESIHPAVLEEMLGVVVTGLNGISRNFNSEFPAAQAAFTGELDYHQISAFIDQAGDKFKAARTYLSPPLVIYEKEVTASPTANGNRATSSSVNGIFAYMLVGMAAMFLLFIAGNSMADLQRELAMHTFARYQTLRNSAAPFLAGKILFTVLLVLICAIIVLGGGGLIFRVHWEHPLALALLTIAYSGFMATWFGLLAAILPDERRAAMLSSITGLALGLVGGCTFPPDNLPAFLRDHVTPLMPSFWFADAARTLQNGDTGEPWGWVVVKLAIVSLVFASGAALLFRRRFGTGLRA